MQKYNPFPEYNVLDNPNLDEFESYIGENIADNNTIDIKRGSKFDIDWKEKSPNGIDWSLDNIRDLIEFN